MKKFLCVALAAGMMLSFAACGTSGNQDGSIETLNAPYNVKVSSRGVITWVGDVNATEYIVTVDGVEHRTSTPYFYLDDLSKDTTFTVTACASGYQNSAAASGKFVKPEVVVSIAGASEIRPKGGSRSGKITLSAKVENAANSEVDWEIVSGGEYAQINSKGELQAAEESLVTSDRQIVVKATSKADPAASATKTVTLTAKTELTQAMLDELQSDKISFDGTVNISLYTFGITNEFYRSFSSDIKTAMDGENWYTEYEDANTGISTGLYYKNYGGVANQVSVSFMNEESYTPMLDEDDLPVTWEDSGLYNNFKGIKKEDFSFNESTWRWEYNVKGEDDPFVTRTIASANPYDFVPQNLALVITDDHIVGIYSKAEPDYSIVEQYEARQELIVGINVGETVKVPTISKFQHAEVHDQLTEAIANMQSLQSYTVDFLNIGGSSFTSGYTLSGYTETVAQDICHFRPFNQNSYGNGENVIRTYTDNNYGYYKFGDKLYNSYSTERNASGYSLNRAFAENFATAKPSFAFAAEIFNMYYEDKEEGTVTFYVNNVMSPVASTFFRGVGNDDALYGIYATEGRTSQSSSFTPYVIVKDGYIVESGFYYYLGYMYGVIEIEYKDFNKATVPEEVTQALGAMQPRQVPTSWSQVNIITTPDSSDEENVENGLVYLKDFFKDEDIEDNLPFFGDALGDTYGFGLTTFKRVGDATKQCIVFYYDVPLDTDYSIESSMNQVKELLVQRGYVKGENDVYTKGGLAVQVVDSSLDLNIYVWKV